MLFRAYYATAYTNMMKTSSGIYTNAVCLTGKKMDEMPHLSDRANIVWDTGLNLGWFFGKGKHK